MGGALKNQKSARQPLRDRALKMLKSGVPVKDVAEKLGVSRQAVYNWDEAAGGVMQKKKKASSQPSKGVIATKIGDRIPVPSPEEIRALRVACGITMKRAAQMTLSSGRYTTWFEYELPVGHKNHHDIPLATWELFLLLTGQHPNMKVTLKSK